MKSLLCILCLLLECVAAPLQAASSAEPTGSVVTPNLFLKRGTPTFVQGTIGDERTKRGVAAQATAIRSMLFPGASIVDDREIDTTKGIGAWPPNPVIFGGPHVNTVLARLASSLPFAMERGKLVLGPEVFEGDEYRLIAVVPSRPPDAHGPGYPEFLLYAGTGSPGVAEINAVRHGGESILVVDRFGRLLSGQWQGTPNGMVEPRFTEPRARRIAWRTLEKDLHSSSGATGIVRFLFPEQLPPADDEAQVIAAGLRGLAQAVRKLEIVDPASMTIYVYPDRASKRSLTADAGDGRTDVLSHAVHVVRFDSSVNDGFERLLSHEGTHVLVYEAWGAAGSPFLAEGVAVWASGAYGGFPLEAWPARLSGEMPPLVELLGAKFRQLPEAAAYPLAGLLIDVAFTKVGLTGVRDHLYSATAVTWETACREAGTSAQDLERALRGRLNAVRSVP